MSFTDNQTWFTVLLVAHVFSAIAGIGPSFAFAVLGPMAAKNPEGALWITRAMVKVEKATVAPAGWFLQWFTGVLLILNRSSIRSNLSGETWLTTAIGLYIIIIVLSILNYRLTHRMVDMLASGRAGSPEFAGMGKKAAMFGMSMTLLTIIIIVLMVWKPGSACAVPPLLRC